MIRIVTAKVTAEPFFSPWMGEGYRRARDAMLAGEASCCAGLWHVLGESHYGSAADHRPSATAEVMRDLAIPGYRFFDTVLSVVADKPVSALDRAEEWNELAFSNFVQDTLPTDDRRPHDQHWRRARNAFFGQLAITRPKQLLVVGKQQWQNLPVDGFNPIGSFEVSPEWGEVKDAGIYAYETEGEIAFTIATWIYHPSSRGLLDVEKARNRVRSVTMVSCNILSQLQRDDEGWHYNDA